MMAAVWKELAKTGCSQGHLWAVGTWEGRLPCAGVGEMGE